MSETRYTPEQMREWADSPNSSHSTAAMLHQAATDAEALEELRKKAVSLAKEVNGQLSLEGPSIREAIGNTNYRCLSDRALAVLALTGDATEGQG